MINASTASVEVTSQTTAAAVGDDHVGTLGQCPARGRRADSGAGRRGHDDGLALQEAMALDLFRRLCQVHLASLSG
ncbi:Uncharacterised protein [Mycobacteroides abscessus subsp. massiliense]|nr:Uncharacterised protein [Mycobacteroides abscessus subsp. massiliense]